MGRDHEFDGKKIIKILTMPTEFETMKPATKRKKDCERPNPFPLAGPPQPQHLGSDSDGAYAYSSVSLLLPANFVPGGRERGGGWRGGAITVNFRYGDKGAPIFSHICKLFSLNGGFSLAMQDKPNNAEY